MNMVMVTMPGLALTCVARALILLCALALSIAAFHGGVEDRQSIIQETARKLIEDSKFLGTEKQFKIFMENYGKNYSTREEYLHRLGIFAKNMIRAAEHQAMDPTAIHGVTPFSDLSEEEFERLYTGMRGGLGMNREVAAGGEAPPLEVEGLPENFDWRKKGAVTEVKMQVNS